ncbi:unnamed protein product [Mytilus edulis]|uniref:Reverse transcriptase/retrotransposon-derived protein RNase H-like domain-containing protein n=1 Tax=Mytilus edulis TaxID=6550 RepID=A0A8S3SSB1_MYTED|nr:unnamed protein product [Mytilus edulis]
MRPSTHVNSDISSKESMSRGDICECAGYSLDDSKRNILKAIQESPDSQPEQENPNSEYLKTNDRQDNVAVIASVKGSSRMMIDGMIEGSAITWKVDTGSRRTFITEQSYYSIMPECRPVLSRIDTQFETADGSTLNILGTAVMNISFGEFCAAFPIYVGGVKINLLGEDFISKYRCQWNFDSGSLDICGFTAPLEQDSVNVRSSRVIAMETIDIPARHEIIVKAKLTREVYAENNSEVFGILCPDSNFMRKYGLAIGRVLVNASRSHIYSRILNPCDTDIILYKGTHIGLFVPAQKIVSDIGLMEEETVCNVREMDTDPQEIPQYMAEMYSNGRENLTESEAESFKEILLKYRDIFYDPAGEPGKTTIGMHSIKLKEEIPVKEPPRRVPLYKRQAIEDEIKKLEDKKLIEKSNSPWSSGLLKAHWEWTSGCEQTFRLLKEKLLSSPVLAYPEIDGEEFILDTDASHFGIGANKDFCKQCNLPWDYVYNNSSDKSDSLNIIDQQCETQHSQIISTIDENENEDLDSEDLPKRRGPKRNAPSKAKGLKKPVIDLSPV